MNVHDEILLARILRQFESGRRFASHDARCPAKGMCMEFNEYDFTRNPVVQNEVFFLQSKCGACGFSVLVRSLEELTEHENLHRTQCSRSDSVA